MSISLGSILRAALVAGLAAGLVTAGFHLAATEAVIDRAVELEELNHLAGVEQVDEKVEPVVSRQGQRGGLVVGFVLYGLMWGLLFSVAYHAGRRWLPQVGAAGRGLLLAALAFWSMALLPFLKYPALPPGVEVDASIGTRQSLYVACLLLSVAVTVLAVAISHRLARRLDVRRSRDHVLLLAGVLVLLSVIPMVALPGQSIHEGMPSELIGAFQLLSLTGLALFWLLFGCVFAWFIRPADAVALRRPEAA